MKTKVVNVHKEPYDICIMRPGIYGSPFPVINGDLVGSVAKFREYFRRRIHNDIQFLQAVGELRGKKLGCCHDTKPCHGDVYVEFLEREGEWVR